MKAVRDGRGLSCGGLALLLAAVSPGCMHQIPLESGTLMETFALTVDLNPSGMDPDSHIALYRLSNVSAVSVKICIGRSGGIIDVSERLTSQSTTDLTLAPGESHEWEESHPISGFGQMEAIIAYVDVYRPGCRKQPLISVHSGPVAVPGS